VCKGRRLLRFTGEQERAVELLKVVRLTRPGQPIALLRGGRRGQAGNQPAADHQRCGTIGQHLAILPNPADPCRVNRVTLTHRARKNP